MADLLPTIKITDHHTVEAGSSESRTDSPGTAEGAQSVRPKSATSSEGNAQANSKKPTLKLMRKEPPSPNGRDQSNIVNIDALPSAASAAPQIDPLTKHILKRTNTENTIPHKLRISSGVPEKPPSSDSGPPGNGVTEPETPGLAAGSEIPRTDSGLGKEKKKSVSFFSRLSSIGGKKKEVHEDADDDESLAGDKRTEGMNAHVFSSAVGANGFIPQHKEPPRYIKVRAHNKKEREFNRMFLAQELRGTGPKPNGAGDTGTKPPDLKPGGYSKAAKPGNAVWTLEFSRDGKYLAAAGHDQVVRVWAVISTSDERHTHEHEEDVSSMGPEGRHERLSAPVFRTKPVREFQGHTSDVLDLAWSKNGFLLSSSMDKTVRLWHLSRSECLCTFKHKDFVTSIAFHPRDDRFFLAGSLDSTLRLWSIPDKTVAFSQQLPDMITAVAFTPDGKQAMAGSLTGLCFLYETEGLKYQTQMHVRSSRGRNAKGSKITGIRTVTYPPDDPEGETKLLITSNDSRIRLYNLRDKSLDMKFKGHENTCSQINARFSDDARYVICGSEDKKTYVWSTGPGENDTKEKRPVEYFQAHADIVTAGAIAPKQTRQLLQASGDPIYDLCNPPPVTLLSKEETHMSSQASTANEGGKRLSDPISEPKKAEESPAYLARSAHPGGNIIITADHTGSIKVFRQDCAFQKRRHDTWETGSTFSKKLIDRSNSIITRHSAGGQTRRQSLNVGPVSSNGTNHEQDRIITWRNSLPSNASSQSQASSLRNGNGLSNVSNMSTAMSSQHDRSISPGITSRTSLNSLHSPAGPRQTDKRPVSSHAAVPKRQILTQVYSKDNVPSSISISTVSPPQSLYQATSGLSQQISQLPTPSFSFASANKEKEEGPARADAPVKGFGFFNVPWKKGSANTSTNTFGGAGGDVVKKDSEKSRGGSDASTGGLKPPGFEMMGALTRETTRESRVSKLSSEEGDDDTGNGDESEGEPMVCGKCGGKEFRARKVKGVGQRLVCGRCGTAAE